MNPSLHFGLEVDQLSWSLYFWKTMLQADLAYRYTSVTTPGLRTAVLTFPQGTLELLARRRSSPFPAPGEIKSHFSLPEDRLEQLYGEMSRRMEALKRGLDPEQPDGKNLSCGSHLLKTFLAGARITPPRRTGDGFDEFSVTDPEGNTLEFGRKAAEAPVRSIKAVIFDLDGTLLDSEENYYQADRELLARRGVPFSREEKEECIGLSTAEMMELLIARYGLTDSPGALAAEKNRIYLDLALRKAELFPKAAALVRDLKARGYPLAVASGSSREVVDSMLQKTGVRDSFAAVVSSEETGKGKPDPGVFLEAARRLGVEPHHCLVLEDAPAGVEAALEAGMACIAIPAPSLNPGHPPVLAGSLLLADRVFTRGALDWDPREFWDWLENRNLSGG